MEISKITVSDFCCFKQFSQNLSKQGLVWVGGENHDTQAAANNGSGKSSIFKALTWGLYGQTIDGEKGDKVIRSGQKQAIVEVYLKDEGNEWIIRRTRKKGAPKLELIQPDCSYYIESKEDVQKKIVDLIGLDFLSFKNTIMYGQNDTARFADPRTKDVDRKEMLHKMLRTGILHHCHDIALENRKKSKRSISKMENETQALTATLHLREGDIEEIKRDREEYEENRKKFIANNKQELQKCKAQAKRYMEQAACVEVDDEEIDVQVAELNEKIAKIDEKIAAAIEAQVAYDKIKPKVERFDEESRQLVGSMATARADLRNATKALESLSGDTCPTCRASLDSGLSAEYKAELMKKFSKSEIDADLLRDQWNTNEEKVAKIKSKEKKMWSEVCKINSYQRAKAEIESKIRELTSAVDKAAAAVELFESKARDAVDRARQTAITIKSTKEEENPYSGKEIKVKKEIRGYEEKIVGKNSRIKKETKEMSYTDFWIRGFSNQGLPSFILDSIVPHIAQRANFYLETLTDGDIVLKIETQREKKSTKGEFLDKIFIGWTIEGVDDSYPPSGGQLKKIEIAVDLALMDLVASRESNTIDLLVLDEVLDGLDAEGCSRVLLLLGELRSRRRSIFVISHDAEVAEIFEKAIFAVKKNGVSEVKEGA